MKAVYFLLLLPLLSFSQWRYLEDNNDPEFPSMAYIEGTRIQGSEAYNVNFIFSHQEGQLRMYLHEFYRTYPVCSGYGSLEVIFDSSKAIAAVLDLQLSTDQKGLFIRDDETGRKKWLDFLSKITDHQKMYLRLTSECGEKVGVYRFSLSNSANAIGSVIRHYTESTERKSNKHVYESPTMQDYGRMVEGLNPFDLDSYVHAFVKDAYRHNIDLSYVLDKKIIIDFHQLEGQTIARAYGINRDSYVNIEVDPENWHNADPVRRVYIMWHELGHDVLNFEHYTGGSMMEPEAPISITLSDLYLDKSELFQTYYRKHK